MLSQLCIILLCVAAVAAVAAVVLFAPGVAAIRRLYASCCSRADDITLMATADGTDADGRELPPVTVLALDNPADMRLEEWLRSIASQNYPRFNVVVVCDADADDTRHFSERFAAEFPFARFTFIPPGSHNLSRRKLAITLGMKAADGKYVLTTSTACSIPSDNWLRLMTEGAGYPDITLGTTRPDFSSLHGGGKWYRQFDLTMRNAQWIAAAAAGNPFRGDGLNLLIERELFLKSGGYSRCSDLTYGDDDIFLSRLLSNTSVAPGVGVQIAPQAVPVPEWGAHTDKTLIELKDRYAFTAGFLPKSAFMRSSLMSWALWLAVVCGVASAVIAFCTAVQGTIGGADMTREWVTGGLAAAVVLALWGTMIAIYRRLATALGAVRLWWAVMPFMLWHPIGNLLFRFRHSPMRHLHYTCRL